MQRARFDVPGSHEYYQLQLTSWSPGSSKQLCEESCRSVALLNTLVVAYLFLQRPSGGYNITVYHDFHEEADSYRLHHWRVSFCLTFFIMCSSLYFRLRSSLFTLFCYVNWCVQCESCGDLIKRAINRKPSATDCIKKAGHGNVCGNSSCHWHR